MTPFKPKTLIGHQQCPECDFPDAEIKTDKSGNPYRYCGGCNAQYFSRGDAVRVKNLTSKMRPLAVAAPAAASPDAAMSAPGPASPVVAVPDDPGPDFKPPKKPTAKKWFATVLDEK